jgi:hypothetical protein
VENGELSADGPSAGDGLSGELHACASEHTLAAAWLAADTQARYQCLVALGLSLFQVLQQATPLGDHRQQTLPGVVVLCVRLEVILKLEDSLAQKGNLYFGRPDIFVVTPVIPDYF